MERCFEDHELSLRFAKGGDLAHVESDSTRAVDSRALDKANVFREKRERAIGLVFSLTKELEKRILSYKNQVSVVEFIRELVSDGLISNNEFPETLLTYIEEKSPSGKSDQVLIFTKTNEGKKTIFTGYRRTDWDDYHLRRKDGKGLIGSVTKGMRNYVGKTHFIFPVKSLDGTRARFLYRGDLGHTILRNIKNKRK